jgi:CubicO group peptidase (beta-lactamase class C family)
VRPFYWEIGDQNSALASGSVGGSTFTANTDMPIASASKWVFGAYIAQLHGGQLTADDISALTMNSGYTNFDEASCIRLLQSTQDAETVNDCFQSGGANGGKNSDYINDNLNHFFYNGGHFQNLAVNLGLGSLNNANLQAAVQTQLGADFNFTYGTPQLAGGVNTSAANYAIFLRKILNNQLAIHDLLGQHAVCTQLSSCSTAIYTPAPTTESWNYSLGHWVESDPATGDNTFSSPGAFGFYPWIDKTKTYYGVLARKSDPGSGFESVYCGRLIRKAWMTGIVQ